MKKVLVILFLIFPFVTFAQEDAHNKKVKEFLEVSGAAQLSTSMMENVIAVFQNSYPQVDSIFWDEFMKEVKTDELIELIIPVYKKYYTENELDQLIVFYKTDIGKKTIEVLPSLTQDSMLIGQKWGMEISQRALKKLKEKGHIKK